MAKRSFSASRAMPTSTPCIPVGTITRRRLYAFDMLAGDGDDYCQLPLSLRKTNLARLLRSRSEGIFAAPFETGEIGPDLFRHACKFGLEGLVSKRRDRPYRGGPSRHWIKVKNPAHPAYRRVQDQFG
jgi:bifunctional non-homologous end joining protein LigD